MMHHYRNTTTVDAKSFCKHMTLVESFHWEDYAQGSTPLCDSLYDPTLDYLVRCRFTDTITEQLLMQCEPETIHLWCNNFYDECEIECVWLLEPELYTRVMLAIE